MAWNEKEDYKNAIKYRILYGIMIDFLADRIKEDKSYEFTQEGEELINEELRFLLKHAKEMEERYEKYTRVKDVEKESTNGSR